MPKPWRPTDPAPTDFSFSRARRRSNKPPGSRATSRKRSVSPAALWRRSIRFRPAAARFPIFSAARAAARVSRFASLAAGRHGFSVNPPAGQRRAGPGPFGGGAIPLRLRCLLALRRARFFPRRWIGERRLRVRRSWAASVGRCVQTKDASAPLVARDGAAPFGTARIFSAARAAAPGGAEPFPFPQRQIGSRSRERLFLLTAKARFGGARFEG